MPLTLVTSKIKKKDQIQNYLSVRIVVFVQIILDHHEQTQKWVLFVLDFYVLTLRVLLSGIFFVCFVKINKSRNTHKQRHSSFHTHWAIILVEKTNRQTVSAGWNTKFSTMKDLLLPGSEGEWESDGEVDQEGIPQLIYSQAQGAFTAIKAILPSEAPRRFL